MLNVCEIFKSIQGESTFAGKPCSFIRLTGCNLSCSYCDTAYARSGGVDRDIVSIKKEIEEHQCSLVEITGGEPLIQSDVPDLCTMLRYSGKTVLIETNGTKDISVLPQGVIKIVDVKTPSSGMAGSFLFSNLDVLRPIDQLKFVISDENDYVWAKEFKDKHRLEKKCIVIFSPNLKRIASRELAEWIIRDNLEVRIGIQIHKAIWGDDTRGV